MRPVSCFEKGQEGMHTGALIPNIQEPPSQASPLVKGDERRGSNSEVTAPDANPTAKAAKLAGSQD